jgi:phosphate transport system substrate-binding protein
MTMLKKLTVSLAAAALACSATAAMAETRVTGAGATFPKPLYLKWVAAFNEKNADVKVDYTGGGSGAGQKALMDKTAQFAGSDAPLTEDQMKKAPAPVIHLPTVAGPVVITYNIPGVANLTLDGDTLAGIYTGKIKVWNDPAIVALNAGVALPGKDIVVAHRSDGSGTTFVFTTYLSSVSKIWAEKVGASTDVKWPKGDGYKGSDGVANSVKSVEGGVGYVELAYAKTNNLPFASMKNADGKVVVADINSVVAAAANVKDIPADLVLNINNAPGDKSYPIAGFTYILVYQDLKEGGMTREQADGLVKFLNWSLTDGQAMAAPDYAKLPDAIQAKVIAKLKTVTYGGETLLK